MSIRLDVHGNRDQIDIFQDEDKLIGQIEDDGYNYYCTNFIKKPRETKTFKEFKDTLLWLEEIL